MWEIFLLCIFFCPIFGIEGSCQQQKFINKTRKAHPKTGVICQNTEVENRWRGELIFEKLRGDTGIKIKWKHLIQRPDCPQELKFFVDSREAKIISPQRYEGSEWIELVENDNFELKVQTLYSTEPSCFEAKKTITWKNKTIPIHNKSHDDAIADSKNGKSEFEGMPEDQITHAILPPIPNPVFDENDTLLTNENGNVVLEEATSVEITTNINNQESQNTKRIKLNGYNNDEDNVKQKESDNMMRINSIDTKENEADNTEIIAASSVTAVLVVIIVVGAIIGRRKCRSGAALEQEDIDENTVYGIYSDDADDHDYIVMQDTCPDYEPADVI